MLNRIINTNTDELHIRKSATRGTPQRGFLSPLSWLVMVNNILRDFVKKGTNLVAHADNVVMFSVKLMKMENGSNMEEITWRSLL